MSNGARHTWGFFIGVILTAALAGLLVYGSYRLQHGFMMQGHAQDKWIGGGLLAAAAIVFALLTASRLSPLGSLIGGLVLTAAGVLFFVSQKTTADLINRFPIRGQRVTLAGLEEEGFILFAGVGLLISSFFPSRWRPRSDADDAYEYGLPDSGESFGRSVPASAPRGGRHAARDDETATPSYGGTSQTEFDVPLYEPDDPYGRRSTYDPPDDGGTREMRRS